jgi:hypothetical protein
MDRQDFMGLYESYMGVYEQDEYFEEDVEEGEKSAFDTMRHVGGPYNESYDLYDLVLEYLLDEGLCESVENAEIMMAHMSEGWVDAIVEGFKPTRYNTYVNFTDKPNRKREQILRQIENLRSKGKTAQAIVVDALNRRLDRPEEREYSKEQSRRNMAKLDARARRDAQRDEKESRSGR